MTARRSRVRVVISSAAARPARAAVASTSRTQRAVLVVTAVLLAALPTLGRVAHAQPTPSARPGPAALPLSVTVNQLTPTAPQPGDELDVGGVVLNNTPLSYDDVRVVVRISLAPLTSRAGLLAVAAATDHFASINAVDPVAVGSAAPGSSIPFLFRLPVDALHLVATGVYRLSVEAFTGSQDNQDFLGRVNTFLPWVPPNAGVAPVGVAWVWPLLSTPTLLPDGTFANDSLGAAVAPRGRLGLLLGVAGQAATQHGTVPDQLGLPVDGVTDPSRVPVQIRPVPVTPVIDPENLQELRLMADPATPYVVGGAPGPSRGAATDYLNRLTALLTSSAATVVTPYGDPDLEAMATAGAGTMITQARSTGIEAGLPGVLPGLLWPPDGALSEHTLEQLTATGLVLSSKAVPVTNPTPLGYTPTATATVDRPAGTVPAVVVDDGLSKLAIKPVKAEDRVLLTQRFAAETAAIAVESAPAGRTLVLAPGRRWSPSQSSIRSVLDESGRLPWLTPMTVPQALAQPTDPAVSRGQLHETATTALLPQQTASRITHTNDELARFRSILYCPPRTTGSATAAPVTSAPSTASPGTGATRCNPDDLVLALQRSLYRAASTAYRLDSAGGDALLAATAKTLHADEAKVAILTKGESVLVGSRARIPVSVANDLPIDVRVKLVLRPRNNALAAGKPVTITIPAGGNVQQDITVQSRQAGGGILYLDAQLLTLSDENFGAPSVLKVRVSAAGVVVVTITIAVCSLLGLAVIVRIFRRVRNHRRQTTDPEPEAAA